MMQILKTDCPLETTGDIQINDIWGPSTVVLITYPDAIYQKGVPTLNTLDEFIEKSNDEIMKDEKNDRS